LTHFLPFEQYLLVYITTNRHEQEENIEKKFVWFVVKNPKYALTTLGLYNFF